MKRYFLISLLSFPLFGQQMDYNQQIKNKPALVNDAPGNALGTICTAATIASSTLVINKNWALNSQTLSCNLSAGGGLIKVNSGQALIIQGNIQSGPFQQIFDISGGGTINFASNSISKAYPGWFGAKSDGSHDDRLNIQAAIDSCQGVNSGGVSDYVAVCAVELPAAAGTFKIEGQLNLYSSSGAYRGMTFCGISKQGSRLSYTNASAASAIRMIGLFQIVCNLSIINAVSSGWIDGIQYDGQVGLGVSSGGSIRDVEIELQGNVGNGISTGRTSYQADQLTIDHPYINGNYKGYGIISLDPNSLSINIYNANINNGWIAIASSNSTNMNITGGEIDDMDLNFLPGQGGVFNVTGVRSEGSKRSIFSTVSPSPQNVTFTSYFVSTNDTTRASTTVAATATTSIITFPVSSTNPIFTLDDGIVIAGAGAAGADLHCRINGIAAGQTVYTIDQFIGTTVTTAAVTLDSTVPQYNFAERSGGPYNHIGTTIYTTSGGAVSPNAVGAKQTFTGVTWEENMTNPFNYTTQIACPLNVSWTGLTSNNLDVSPIGIPNYIPILTATQSVSNSVYVIADNSLSSDNAIVASPVGWCYPDLEEGLLINLQLRTNTLQAGANTLTYGGHIAVVIKSSATFSADIPSGYTVQTLVPLIFSAGILQTLNK